MNPPERSSRRIDLTGRTVGEYEIIARLGEGGMGVVYEGRQPIIGKRVAVKVLLPHLSSDQELVERFVAEARAVNAIRHRGIVDIFSFGTLPDGTHYFVMEFLEGQSFDHLLKQCGRVPPALVLDWTAEILDALDAAHTAGVIHRDIKPSNLFLVDGGRGSTYVKLLDFGIAKLGPLAGQATPQTRASVIIGTPDYMAPEQVRGKPVSPATDLYALGCVMFELICGQRPFVGENSMQTMFMHVEQPPPRPSDKLSDLPPELDQLILWMLEKNPAARPSSAAAALEHVWSVRQLFSEVPGVWSPRTPRPHLARTPPPSSRLSRSARSTGQPSSDRHSSPGSGVRRQGSASGRQSAVASPPAHDSSLPASWAEDTVADPGRAISPAHPEPEVASETRVAPRSVVDSFPTTAEVPRQTAVPPTVLLPETSLSVHSAAEAQKVVPPGASPVPAEEPLGYRPTRSKAPLLALAGVLVIGGAAGAYLWRTRSAGTDSAGSPHPLEEPASAVASETVSSTDAEPMAREPEAKASGEGPGAPSAGEAVSDEQAKSPNAGNTIDRAGPTQAALSARLRRLEKKLAEREAATGAEDRVLRRFLEQARRDIARASTDERRREAWKFLDEIQRELR